MIFARGKFYPESSHFSAEKKCDKRCSTKACMILIKRQAMQKNSRRSGRHEAALPCSLSQSSSITSTTVSTLQLLSSPSRSDTAGDSDWLLHLQAAPRHWLEQRHVGYDWSMLSSSLLLLFWLPVSR
jgi:hypothetical protein